MYYDGSLSCILHICDYWSVIYKKMLNYLFYTRQLEYHNWTQLHYFRREILARVGQSPKLRLIEFVWWYVVPYLYNQFLQFSTQILHVLHHNVWDFVAVLKTHWWPLSVFRSLVRICLFVTFPISILNFVVHLLLWNCLQNFSNF